MRCMMRPPFVTRCMDARPAMQHVLQTAYYGQDKYTYVLAGPAAFGDVADICDSMGLDFVGYNTTRANMRVPTLAVDELCARDACWVGAPDAAAAAARSDRALE